MQVGRPKDLAKRQMILEAAKSLFLKQGFHGSTMNQIAQEAGVTKLTVYNHFQDKESPNKHREVFFDVIDMHKCL